MADPKTGVEEIPFDVADWGGRVVQEVFATGEERQAFLAATETNPAFLALKKRADELKDV